MLPSSPAFCVDVLYGSLVNIPKIELFLIFRYFYTATAIYGYVFLRHICNNTITVFNILYCIPVVDVPV